MADYAGEKGFVIAAVISEERTIIEAMELSEKIYSQEDCYDQAQRFKNLTLTKQDNLKIKI